MRRETGRGGARARGRLAPALAASAITALLVLGGGQVRAQSAAPPAYPPATLPGGAPPPPYAAAPNGAPLGAVPIASFVRLGLPSPTVPPGAGPRLLLRTNTPSARLQQLTPKAVDVCFAPCGLYLNPTLTYRVAGGTTRPSESFQLPRPTGDVMVEAEMGSKIKHFVGLGLMIGGAVAVGYGVFYWAFFHEAVGASTTDPYGNQSRQDARTAGTVFLITGVVIGGILEAIGIPLWLSNTHVEVR